MENAELVKALREDAEWAHGNEWETPITLGDHLDAAATALEAADKRISELEAALQNWHEDYHDNPPEAAQRWISAKDPPKYTGDYNVVCNIGSMLGGYTDVRTYRFERIKGREPKWCIPNSFDEIVSITHWQPLPQPPQKGE